MILEIAEITIQDGTQAEFEAKLKQGLATYTAKTDGYINHTIQHCMENTTFYMLMIEWESLEAHTVNFRQGPNYEAYRALISPFFDSPPLVRHYERVDSN